MPAPPFIVDNNTSISATTPQHDSGAVPVGVTEANDTTVVVGGFFFAPAQPTPNPPTIASITPNTGSTAGHTLLVIAGSNFRLGTSVTFDGTAATDIHVLASGVLTARTPFHVVAEAVDVTVTSRTGRMLRSRAAAPASRPRREC